MSDLEQKIVKYARWYQTTPRAQYNATKPGKFDSWYKSIHQHLHNQFLPSLRTRGEKFVEYYPAYMLWGTSREYKRGFADSRTYLYKSGTFATGYVCATDINLHLVILRKLTKEFPLVEGGAEGFLSSVFKGMSGERDTRFPSEEDRTWTIPYQSILSVGVTQDPFNEVSTVLKIMTGTELWHIYEHFNGQEQQIETVVRMGAAGELHAIFEPPKPAPKHTSEEDTTSSKTLALLEKLKALKESGVLTEAEFETKKRELLSRL